MFGIGNSKSKSQTDNYNIGSGSQQDNNKGVVNYGDGNVRYTVTDHGAVQGALAGNTATTQAALLANNSAIQAALASSAASTELAFSSNTATSQTALMANNNAVHAALSSNEAVTSEAFGFGSKALDMGSYSIESSAAFADAALGTVSETTGSVVDKIASFASEILANGQRATTGALQFAKDTNRSDSAAQTEMMIKAVSVLGIVAVLAFAFGGKK